MLAGFLLLFLGCNDTETRYASEENKAYSHLYQKAKQYGKIEQKIKKQVADAETLLRNNPDNATACRELGNNLGESLIDALDTVTTEYGRYTLIEELELAKVFTLDQVEEHSQEAIQREIDKVLLQGELSAEERTQLSDAIMAAFHGTLDTVDRELVQLALNKMERSHIEALQKHCLCPQCNFTVQDHPHVRTFLKDDGTIHEQLCQKAIQHNADWYCTKRRELACNRDTDYKLCYVWEPSLFEMLERTFKNALLGQ